LPVTVEIGGAAEFYRLADRLRQVADSDRLKAAMQHTVDGFVPRVADAAHAGTSRLPQRGGLARRVAGTRIVGKARASRRTAGVRIVAERGAVSDPGGINRGVVRHPTYGHKPYVIQHVPPGWFTDPVKAQVPAIREALIQAVRGEILLAMEGR
jgi:hypothetical protein